MPSSSNLTVDRLRNAEPGEPVEVWVYSAFEKDQWTVRHPADFTHAEHPGTAIQMGNDLYEVMTSEGTIEPGYVVRYGLKKWDNRHAVRRTLHYTPEARAQAVEEHLDELHRQELRKWIVRLFFLAGMAPDPLQRKWGRETALNMAVVSAASALANCAVCMTLIIFFGQQMTLEDYAGQPLSHPHLISLISYLGLDTVARLIWIAASGAPHSTIVVALPSLLWDAVMRRDQRDTKREWVKSLHEDDEVIRRSGTDNLTIRSMLYDDLLLGAVPITFEGNAYKSLHWHEEGKGLQRRWVYEFEKVDADPKLKIQEYTRPRTPARQEIVEEFTRRRDKVHIMAMVWGTFPGGEQWRLQEKYQFPAAHWTAVTAGLFLAGAVLQGEAMILLHLPVEFLACPAYMVFESLYRLNQSKSKGQPAASVLGLFLSVFVHPPK